MSLDLLVTLSPEHSIFPTKHCFDDALEFVVAVLQANPAEVPALRRSLKVVHGICTAPDGHPYAHAWAEDDQTGLCYFRGIVRGELWYFGTPKDQYYAEVRVQERTRYSVRSAADHNKRHGTYGPWLPKYLALCTPRTDAQEAACPPAP
jgi:hypothetical protein